MTDGMEADEDAGAASHPQSSKLTFRPVAKADMVAVSSGLGVVPRTRAASENTKKMKGEKQGDISFFLEILF